MAGIRHFDFDHGTTRLEAIRGIVAALDDEGLELTESDNARFSAITTVLVDGVYRVIVPEHRIRTKGQRPVLRTVCREHATVNCPCEGPIAKND